MGSSSLVLRVLLITLLAASSFVFSRASAESRDYRDLTPEVHSLPSEGRPNPHVLAEGDIIEEELQENRPLAPGWMGSPPAPIVPVVPEGTLPAEPEGR
ncbi:MAG: hypothetical protein ACE5FB_08265, partial [Candidatus Binatia bacterium]